MSELIPFGKYKGLPIESLYEDRAYTDWLLAQPWFKQRHPALFSVVINNFAEPTDTPEHNRLQVMFLRPEVRASLSRCIAARTYKSTEGEGTWVFRGDKELDFETHNGLDVRFTAHFRLSNEFAKAIGWRLEDLVEKIWMNGRWVAGALPSFFNDRIEMRIEIKPAIGDDYPSILRQAKRSCANVLFCQSISADGATDTEIIDIFHLSKIEIVRLSEI